MAATWILILYVFAGGFSKGDSVALTNASFYSEKACISAGEKVKKFADGTTKEFRFACVKNTD